MEIEELIYKSNGWLNELNHKQLVHALVDEKDYDLDKTVELLKCLVQTVEDLSELDNYFDEKISSVKEESYDEGYSQAIQDVVFELNNQGVDDDIVSLIEDIG